MGLGEIKKAAREAFHQEKESDTGATGLDLLFYIRPSKSLDKETYLIKNSEALAAAI